MNNYNFPKHELCLQLWQIYFMKVAGDVVYYLAGQFHFVMLVFLGT